MKLGSRGTAVLSTREAVLQPAQNFLAWADFKPGTAAAFTRAVESGTEAIHAADPAASLAIEGAKSPAGTATIILAGSVEAMELYGDRSSANFRPMASCSFASLNAATESDSPANMALSARSLLVQPITGTAVTLCA